MTMKKREASCEASYENLKIQRNEILRTTTNQRVNESGDTLD